MLRNIAKQKKKKGGKTRHTIKREEFLERIKKSFPEFPELLILTFWAMLAPEYKLKGRDKDK